MTTTFQTVSPALLSTITGGLDQSQLPAGAQKIIGYEATRDHANSTAAGPFALLVGQRKHYMGADYQSTDFAKQYDAANSYVRDRYQGSWDTAADHWNHHGWY